MDNKRILEALQVQPLSEEEKASRHILGRLYGPIATSLESTRNGRKYNRELWEKALADDIFKEKIETKSLLLELGHPLDREETVMSQVCACIPEMPKIVDGDLYAYVDILDTVNGRTLKTLIDYGFVPGISSRGSGDIMDNDEVDPETFFLETWDIVQLPAVKKARLAVCESVDPEIAKMKKALTESYEAASEEDKNAMKEALDNLHITLDEARGDKKANSIIMKAPEDLEDFLLKEDADEEEIEDAAEEAAEEANADLEATEAEETTDEANAELEVDTENEEPVEIQAIDIIKSKLDIHGDGNEIIIAAKGMLDDENAPKINVEVSDEEFEALEKEFHNEDGQNSEKSDDNKAVEPAAEEAETEAEANLEAQDDSDEAIDDGTDETLESLKEMIRQKDALEDELKNLKVEKTVSDAEVKGLKEEVERYKVALGRVSELASKATKFKQEVSSLQEQLAQKDTQINELNGRAASTAKLTESMNENASRVTKLQEKLTTVVAEHKAEVEKLNEEVAQGKTKLAERTKVAQYYKTQFAAVLNRYVESKASMLGVKPSEITRRLNEKFTIDDVDSVCDDILTQGSALNRPLAGLSRNVKVKVNESVAPQKKNNDDWTVDDLMEFAGLK